VKTFRMNLYALTYCAASLWVTANVTAAVRFVDLAPGAILPPLRDLKTQVEVTLDNGSVESVVFEVGGPITVKKTATVPPYQFTWKAYNIGDHYLRATAKVAGSGETFSADLVVKVLPIGAPWIVEEPRSQTIELGGAATFNTRSVSRGTTRYQWQFNGADIVGATNLTLTVTNAAFSDAGFYSVIAECFAGRAAATAELTVSPKSPGPYGTIRASNHTDNIDAPILAGTQGIGDAYVVDISAGPTLTSIEGGVTFTTRPTNGYFSMGTIGLRNIAPGAKAYIQVRAWYDYPNLRFDDARARSYWGKSKIIEVTTGTDAASAPELLGLTGFKIYRPGEYASGAYPFPAFQTWSVGSSVALTPAVWFGPATKPTTDVTYQWRKNGVLIPDALTRAFNLNNVQLADAGSYQIAATDGIDVMWLRFHVPIDAPPEFTFQDGLAKIFGGVPGRTFAIESSEDFVTWTPATTAVTDGSELSVDASPGQGEKKFFRANFEP
jgi:hypothetical protein